jgi:hypothetical protein
VVVIGAMIRSSIRIPHFGLSDRRPGHPRVPWDSA